MPRYHSLVVLAVALLARVVPAQQVLSLPRKADSSTVPIARPLVMPVRAGVQRSSTCLTLSCSEPVVAQDSARVSQRGRYALWGLAVGAAVGWFVGNEACRREECYVSGAGLLMTVGAVLGLIVGVAISP